MFLMMNEARLLVGLQGFSCATSAYLYALNYARERIQGKNLLQHEGSKRSRRADHSASGCPASALIMKVLC